MAGGESPALILSLILGFAVALSFLGTVLAVAGANVKKCTARLAMFLGITAFVLGAAMLTVVTLFRTILPLEALRRLAEGSANAFILF